MGSFSSPNEARPRSYASIEDTYNRKLQKGNLNDPSLNSNQEKLQGSMRCKITPLKLGLVLIFSATVIILLYSPPLCSHKLVKQHDEQLFAHYTSSQNIVKRWIWGGDTDPRYMSDLEISWHDTRKVIKKLEEKEYHSIGLLNFDENEINGWKEQISPDSEHTILHLDCADEEVTWDELYPEWIDEEQESDVPVCPTLPKLEAPRKRLDLIAVKLPCRREMANWSRDVARLHLQLASAGLAASAKGSYPVHLVFVTECFPIPNLFTCKDLVVREGDVWLYKPNLDVLREKVQLPVGSCELAVPLKTEERSHLGNRRREAYATILHSAEVYVCGAIAAAQSIRMAGSNRDLVILVDETITAYYKSGLQAAGWKVKTIQRIRNPKAEKDAYNEWNYSKFRLWQLTEYDKIIFIDADLLILRNIDFLFNMPQISATGNNGSLFNSGVMVVEPSNCTFQLLMDHINEIASYNGGDQGYLNEIFTWWHRIPKHINFLKHFWIGDVDEVKKKKTMLFGAEPPILYVLHYLGIKPWLCYRDYDCNWNSDIFLEFASDVAHARWWKVHDSMPERLQQFCLLKSKQKAQLEWDSRQAEKGNYKNGHWKIKVQDKRLKKCVDKLCNWKSMLRHWGETNWTDDASNYPTPPTVTTASLNSL